MASRLVGWLTGARAAVQDPSRLVDTMVRGRDQAAKDRALAALERLWTQDAERRPRIWAAIWTVGLGSYTEPPPTVLRFLLAPEPPSVRMVAYLPRNDLLDVPSKILTLARFGPQHDDVAAVLAATGEPRLLAVLEEAFAKGIRHHASYSMDLPTHRLWEDDDTPTPLLRMVLANPHLPRPRPAILDLAALMALRQRYELLTSYDGTKLVFHLLEMLRYDPPAPAAEALRQALRHLPPGPAREQVCWWAMSSDHDEATAAAIEAGYRPAEPDLVPIFLTLTRQWDEYSAVDPDGTALYEFCAGDGLADTRTGPNPIGHLLEILDGDDDFEDSFEDSFEDEDDEAAGDDVPAAVRQAVRRALRDLGPGDIRQEVCDHAQHRDGTARQVVVDAGYLPSDPDEVAAFLYLTRQWDRYDATDPDGALLRTFVDALPSWSFTQDDLREAAKEAGRPMPCAARDPGTPTRYRPGGTGLSGTGGYGVHI